MPRLHVPLKKAKARSDVRHLHRHCRAVDQHDLVAPVELVGFTRIEAQRHIGIDGRRGLLPIPAPGVASHRVVAAFIAKLTKRLIDPHQCQPFAPQFGCIRCQQPIQFSLPPAELRQRLNLALIGELTRPGAQDLAHRVARDVLLADDLLDRFAPHEELAPDARNRVHALHLPHPSRLLDGQCARATLKGVNIGRRSPASGGQNCTPIHNAGQAGVGHQRQAFASEVVDHRKDAEPAPVA
jgi:hypothetical protein